jgi:hypothetical protein
MGSRVLIAGPNGAHFGVAVPSPGFEPQEIQAGRESMEAGLEVRARLLAALAKETDEKRVRALAACVRDFPEETLRCPEVHQFLEWLVTDRRSGGVDRILGDRSVRGRPIRGREEVYFEVAVIEAIIRRDGCSVPRASETARREHEALRHKSAVSLESDYCRNRDAYRLINRVRFLPASAVTDREWSRPDRR